MTAKRSFLPFLITAIMALLFAGCASTKAVDWNSRLGTFSYDQAVVEMGPPDRSTKLSDGSTVAEWLQKRNTGGGMSFGIGTGFTTGGVGIGVGQTVSPAPRNQYLRLTFDNAGKLSAWEKIVR